MTILNIHQVKSRVHITNVTELRPVGNFAIVEQQTQKTEKKLDRRLFLMLFTQIILLSLFTLPQAIQKLYSTAISNQILSPLQTAINNFIFNFVLLLTYFASGMPFYIYTLI
jgi:hypothetical protein